MQVNKKNFGMLVAYVLISLICLLYVNEINNRFSYEQWITPIAIVTLIHSLISILMMHFVGCKINSMSQLFLLCIFLFHYGQIWLFGLLEFYDYDGINMLKLYPEVYCERTCFYIIVVIALYTFGVMLRRLKINDGKSCKISCDKRGDNLQEDDERAIRAGYVVLLITLPFYLLVNGIRIKTSVTSGYLRTFDLKIPEMINTIGYLSLIGFVLLILGYSGRRRFHIAILAVITYGIAMISGYRGEALCAMLTIAVFLFGIEKINGKKLIIIAILGFIVLLALATIAIFRGYPNKTIKLFLEIFQREWHNNFILSNIGEFGGTIATPCIAQIYLHETNKYLYGWTYFSGLLSVFPNISGTISKIFLSGSASQILVNHGVYGAYKTIGDSFIAELMMNFKYLWWIVAGGVGWILESICIYMDKQTDVLKKANYVMMVYAVFRWVRWGFGQGVRLFVWGYILLYLVKGLLKMSKS